ncbi:LysR family transcriptional regulator [Vibrio cionasavignyae]|uniref:LysR family transcriptional regulator n=1 Tax=Vibrio cionasavignyae TaxID=2910252 RepID=UPI003D0A1822
MYSDEQLRVFSKVAESGSFSKVASEIGRTQSAVSLLVAKLETELGYQVFDRIGKKIEINSRGQKLYRLCQQRALAIGRLSSIANALQQQVESEIRIFIDREINPASTIAALKEFHQQFPHTQIVMQEDWKCSDFALVADELIEESDKRDKLFRLFVEDTFIPVTGPEGYKYECYIQVPWGPQSVTSHHLMTSCPNVAIQMVVNNMGWCWISEYLLEGYHCGVDYIIMEGVSPIFKRYSLASRIDSGPGVTWLAKQILAIQNKGHDHAD